MMWQTLLFRKFLIAGFIAVSFSYPCSYPGPAHGFSNDAYEGEWFEIGKIQTAGGFSFFTLTLKSFQVLFLYQCYDNYMWFYYLLRISVYTSVS